ncbi:hypothetical protein G3480_12995 [Thiorhodococcus mannitoliphagus]|uniref:Uncharacterized protein n=1 Tax=Thiorhodococcus mannitoliphagus TaxID=329406 RepID=A0A6P1DUR5_9GAMM|nr:hypothetical protein [Thiorhodococcus mannitoliphagus]NEX21220.1 hypothetical protein [Thiorhodococcus mannitoliphagus]
MKNQKLLICATHSGLANRLKCLISSIRISELINRDLRLYWPINERCGGRFSDIIRAPISEVESVKNGYFFGRDEYVRDVPETSIIVHTWRFALLESDVDEKLEYVDFVYDLNKIPDALKVSLCNAMRRLMIPSLEVQQKVEGVITNEFMSEMIGVHVRRTDHKLATSSSPNETIWRGIQEAKIRLPNAGIFLSTDCKKTEEEFLDKLGSMGIVYRKSEIRRDTREGIEDALADLLLLAKCDLLVVSASSTYSELAWWLGGHKPVIVANKKN